MSSSNLIGTILETEQGQRIKLLEHLRGEPFGEVFLARDTLFGRDYEARAYPLLPSDPKERRKASRDRKQKILNGGFVARIKHGEKDYVICQKAEQPGDWVPSFDKVQEALRTLPFLDPPAWITDHFTGFIRENEVLSIRKEMSKKNPDAETICRFILDMLSRALQDGMSAVDWWKCAKTTSSSRKEQHVSVEVLWHGTHILGRLTESIVDTLGADSKETLEEALSMLNRSPKEQPKMSRKERARYKQCRNRRAKRAQQKMKRMNAMGPDTQATSDGSGVVINREPTKGDIGPPC